ncbi:MAG: DUF4173 domain-containing protein [Sulfurovum sp.]|nr:DUF4173 domain-containing protein [Sulfurovum sp.]
MINLLFLTFILMQIPFLFTGYIQEGTNIASFAREGFFQLMMLMGLVSLIFIFILKRHKNEKTSSILLISLLIQTIIIGIVSLKKMYLYQSIMGATVLRYYVEWFDYFLLLMLFIGIIFILKRYAFHTLLNILVLLGCMSFAFISSLNIDAMVAKHNIEKFQDQAHKLDIRAIKALSIDALPIIQKYKIQIPDKYYREEKREKCINLKSYHYGYCKIFERIINNDSDKK